MKPILHCVLWSLLLSAPVCLADPPEVTAARTAAEKHNGAIEDASQRLEKAIAAARREHTKQIIAAKERMIVDLRKAYRTALRGKTPENAGTIERQIKRLEAQIKELKSEVATPPPPPEVKLKGLDPRLVGVVSLSSKLGHSRVYEIDGRGRVTVLFDPNGKKPGSDIGETYQGVIRDGRLFVHLRKWTIRNQPTGWVQDFLIADNGMLIVRHTEKALLDRRAFDPNHDISQQAFDGLKFDTPESFRKAYKRQEEARTRDNDEIDNEDVDPDFVKEDDDVQEDLDEEVDFFGIPIN